MSVWVDPRAKPAPPYRGHQRHFAEDTHELSGLVSACKEGRIYDVEVWVASGRPLQSAPGNAGRVRQPATPLKIAIAEGTHDLVLLLLCNGYRADLEPRSPLNDALDARRWDLLELLLDWGADPRSADVWQILDTYDRSVLERFWNAGVDLTEAGAMANWLATSTRNRPLYGFVKNYRDQDPRIQRALDVGLGAAIHERCDKGVSLCLWAGANPRRRVGNDRDEECDDDDGMTAFERAIFEDAPHYLKTLGFDKTRDEFQPLYESVFHLNSLRFLTSVEPPDSWHRLTERFISRLAFQRRLDFGCTTGLWDLEEVFQLGGCLGPLAAHSKRDVRQLLLTLDEREAQRLFCLLREPENMDPDAFIDLIAHEKLAACYSKWPRRVGLSKRHLEQLAATPRLPASLRRWVKSELAPPPPRTETCLGRPPQLYTREELYHLVWSEPIVSLAQRFEMSDNGLRKHCRLMKVPTPPRGYWQRVEHERRAKPIPLPELK